MYYLIVCTNLCDSYSIYRGTNSGQRGTVHLSLRHIEMIYGQFSLGKTFFIHLVRASQSLSSSTENFLASHIWHDKQGKIADRKTERKSIQHKKQPPPGRKVTDSPSPAQVKVLVLLGTRCDHPSLLLAHRESRKLRRWLVT